MIQTVIFLLFSVLSAASLAGILLLSAYCLIAHFREKTKPKPFIALKKTVVFFTAIMILNVGLVILSQRNAFTPRIVDEYGNTPNNSIAELTELELNGRKQWISLRGWDKNSPVLLFLAGGPGGSQMAAVRHELEELEKHFVVVNWDQPGSEVLLCGKDEKHYGPNLYSGWLRFDRVFKRPIFPGKNLFVGGIVGQCLGGFPC